MTTRAKHTPGPWEIHDPQGNPQLVREKNGAQELVVDCESVFREEEEDIANARLIAAAPEMAELLEKRPCEPGDAFAQQPSPERTGDEPVFPPGPGDGAAWERVLAGDPTLEPALCRMADGMADRVDRLRCCGNGVVPLVAAYAFRALDARLRADGPHTGDPVLMEAAE